MGGETSEWLSRQRAAFVGRTWTPPVGRLPPRSRPSEPTGDPIEDIRRDWDAHVRFGLDNAGFYALMYAQVTPRRRPEAAGGPHDSLLGLCEGTAAQGWLAMSAAAAADHVLAANVGVTLLLITAEEPELALADQCRA